MRNAALRGVLTGHVMSLDAGMTPPGGLKEDINALIGNETDEKFVLFVKLNFFKVFIGGELC